MLWFWITIFIMALAIGGYFLYKKYADDKTVRVTLTGDIITITDEGGKIETYIEPTMKNCIGGGNDPAYCMDMDETTEMSYVYDPVGGSVNDSGGLQTTYDPVTRVCSDGTSDCVFTEKFDDERKLLGITNDKGEDFIQKLMDDMWSNKLGMDKVVPSPNGGETTVKDQFKNIIAFNKDTGEMFFNRNGKRVKIIPGNMRFVSDPDEDVKEWGVSVGMMIMYIMFYYYGNDLPKPTIKLDLKSEKTLGELYFELKAKQSQP